MSETKLKPCPFCGDDALETGNNLIGVLVGCSNPECLVCCDVKGKNRAEAYPAWNTRPFEKELVDAAQALVDAMETCHQCKGTVLVEEYPVYCEDCSYDCESHEGSECATLYSLHLQLKQALNQAGSQ